MAAAAVPTVSAASLAIFLVINDAADDQTYDHNQNSSNDHCSHGCFLLFLNRPLRSDTRFFLLVYANKSHMSISAFPDSSTSKTYLVSGYYS